MILPLARPVAMCGCEGHLAENLGPPWPHTGPVALGHQHVPHCLVPGVVRVAICGKKEFQEKLLFVVFSIQFISNWRQP